MPNAARPSTTPPGNPVAEASQALRLGRERHGAGAYREAAAYFREALRLRESAFGESDARTLDAVRHLAAAVAAMGELDEAAELQGRALAGSSDVAARVRTRLADDAAALARLQGRLKEWDSAASLWLVVLRERRAALGADHPDTLHALAQLAVSLQSGGKVRRAERAWRRLLAAREAVGAPAADIAAVRERIADCLAAQEQRGEALAMRLRAMGERDPAASPTPPDATRTARLAPEAALMGGNDAEAGPGAALSSRSHLLQRARNLLGVMRDGRGTPHNYRRLAFAAALLVLLLCAFAVVRYEMNRDGAVQEEEVEWYMEPPSQLGAPSTDVYTPD